MTSLKNPQFLFLALAFVALAASAMAEVPQLINYQGRLTNPDGDPVPNAPYSIVFTIYDNASTAIWQETHASVATSDGLFNVLLGAGDHSGYGDLDESIFSDSVRWLGIKVGEDPEITPRTRLVSVPYAHQATRVGYADSAGTLVDGGSGDITGVEAGHGLTGGGTTGDVILDVGVGGGLNWGEDFIYIANSGVTSDKILDGTITASDIDNTSVQQRVTGAGGPGEYIKTINADGSVVVGVDQTGTSKKMCADMYDGMTNSSSQVTITFPVTFTAAPYFSVTGLIKSGGQAGKMAHVVVSSLTTSSVTVTIQFWDGAIFDNVGDSVEILLSYTAMEK